MLKRERAIDQRSLLLCIKKTCVIKQAVDTQFVSKYGHNVVLQMLQPLLILAFLTPLEICILYYVTRKK